MGALNSIFVNKHKMGIVAMLFGTGELMIGLSLHGTAQLGMLALAGISFIVMIGYFRLNKGEKHSKVEGKRYKNTFANLEEFK